MIIGKYIVIFARWNFWFPFWNLQLFLNTEMTIWCITLIIVSKMLYLYFRYDNQRNAPDGHFCIQKKFADSKREIRNITTTKYRQDNGLKKKGQTLIYMNTTNIWG